MRYTVIIPDSVEIALNSLCEMKEAKKSTVMGQAILFYQFISEQVNNGNKIVIRENDGKTREIVFL